MTKRLVWNFELQLEHTPETDSPQEMNDSNTEPPLTWEKRFFWTENQTIELCGLTETTLDFTDCKLKHRDDLYYLIDAKNIKKRKGSLVYKPLVNIHKGCYGFGKKINLFDNNHPPFDRLIQQVESTENMVFVKKTAFIFKFKTTLGIKLELAKLLIKDKVYFTACVEGESCSVVEQIATLIFKGQHSGEYVSFLGTV